MEESYSVLQRDDVVIVDGDGGGGVSGEGLSWSVSWLSFGNEMLPVGHETTLSLSLSLSGSLALSKYTSSQPTISFVRRQYKYSYSAPDQQTRDAQDVYEYGVWVTILLYRI
jgi:hypothetical protein